MASRIAVFGAVLLAISKSWFVWLLLLPWGLLGAYDLFISQFIPEPEAKDYPKAFILLGQLMNWMPWWGWGFGLVVIFLFGVLEYVYKTQKGRTLALVGTPPLAPSVSPPPMSSTSHGSNSQLSQFGVVQNSTVTVNQGVNPRDDSALGNHLEYSKWTNEQLKLETRKIVAVMRTLQLEREVQVSNANRIVPGESQQQRLARRAVEIGAIDAPILAKHGVLAAPNARAMFIAIVFRLGQSYKPEPGERIIGEQAITGYALNGEAIKNGADYLEKLAHRLP